MLFSRFLLSFLSQQMLPHGSICPDDHKSIIGHYCKLTDSDYRDPLTFGSDWARLSERVTRRRRMRRSSCAVTQIPESHPKDLKCRRSYWPPRRAALGKARSPSALRLPPSGPGTLSA